MRESIKKSEDKPKGYVFIGLTIEVTAVQIYWLEMTEVCVCGRRW